MTESSPLPIAENSVEEPRLTDEQLGNLLAAVGNHEVKALTLIAMRPDIVYTKSGLHRLQLEMQGTQIGWNISRGIGIQYCRDSLAPIGLVTKEVVNPDTSVYGYAKTSYGEGIGVALAGHLLAFSEKHPDVSLAKIWGSTTSVAKPAEQETDQGVIEYKKRSPSTRLKIFWELATAQLPIRMSDLALALGEETQNLTQHIQKLASANLLTYESTVFDQDFAFYRLKDALPDIEPDHYEGYPEVSKEVYEILKANPDKEFSVYEVVDAVVKRNANRSNNKRSSVKTMVNLALANLEKQGFAQHGKFTNTHQSEITLTDQQREIIEELALLTDHFLHLNPDFLEKGRRFAYDLLSNPERVSAIMKKSKESSPHANMTSSVETGQNILALLSEHPHIASPQIQSLLKERYEKDLTLSGLRAVLRQLRMQGLIRVAEEKSAQYWALNTTE